MKEIVLAKAEFIKSSGSITDCPKPDKPEFAFIGRSNVGKSSLINMLCNHKGLAKVSSTPGKTIAMNHYLINNTWYLVDLPGYGYAKRSRFLREKWEQTLDEYLTQRENLICVFVLVDSRIPPQKIDIEFINALGGKGIPLCYVFTKIDKNTPNETRRNINAFNKSLLEYWEELPPSFNTSATQSTGRQEILKYVIQSAKAFKRHF